MPSAGFETAIPAILRPQTYDLDHMVTGIGHSVSAVMFCLQRPVNCTEEPKVLVATGGYRVIFVTNILSNEVAYSRKPAQHYGDWLGAGPSRDRIREERGFSYRPDRPWGPSQTSVKGVPGIARGSNGQNSSLPE